MKQSVWQRLDLFARHLSPVAITLLLVMAGMVPLRIPDVAPVLPSLALIAVYYWTVHRPDLMPAWAVFLIGLFQDLLGGGPVGVGVLALLAVHAVVAGQSRFFASATFAVMWIVFALVAAGALALMWLLASLVYGVLLDPRPASFQFLTTIAVYPCLAWIFAQAQRSFLR